MKFFWVIPFLLFACSHVAPVDPETAREQLQTELMLNQIHHLNGKELALAKIAEEKSRVPEVRDLAAQVKNSHGALDRELAALAKRDSVRLEKYDPTTVEEISFRRLRSLDGPAFDDALRYVLQESQRQTSTQLFQLALRTDQPAVVKLLGEALPEVRRQEQAANDLGVLGR